MSRRPGRSRSQVSAARASWRPATAASGAIDLNAYGTTAHSTITITQTQPRYHAANQLLAIQNLNIRSGQLGGPGGDDGRARRAG